MRNNKLISLLLLAIVILAFAPKDEKHLLLWNENRKLTWDDFQGKRNERIISESNIPQDQVIQEGNRKIVIHTETDAYCYHQLNFSSRYKDDTIIFDVKNMFDKSKSWKNSESAYILNHEQRHFDIAEVYARKFRKYLTDNVNTFNSVTQNKLFNDFFEEEKVAQKKYDTETNHSINEGEQMRYDIEIDSLLNEYSAYTDFRVKKYAPRKPVYKRSRR